MTDQTPPLRTSRALFGDPRDDATWSWRQLVFPSVFLVYLLQTANGVTLRSHGAGIAAGLLILVAFCACYVVAMTAGRIGRYRLFWRCYAGLVVLCALELPFAHQDAFVMLVYIAVLSIAAWYEKSIPVLVLMILIAGFVPPLVPGWHAGVDGSLIVSIAIVSLAMFGFFGLVRSNEALAEARSEVARLAAENERSRIARDLHDLLGHSLTSITVKAALAHRLAKLDPERAAVEIAEVEALARATLTDVRAAVAGYREATLGNELAAAREVLRAAGITAQLPRAIDAIGQSESELFAWVLREGVTNVVRHSRATTCEVRLGQHSIEIIDDGVGSDASAGNGLTGLQERVSDAGGRLEVGAGSAHKGWRLRVEVAGS
jgi:two-component system sensor histidine kinase DesK